jgi:hypothetical protein
MATYAAYDCSSVFERRIADFTGVKDKSLTDIVNQALTQNISKPDRLARKVARDFFEVIGSRINIGRYNQVLQTVENIYHKAYEEIIEQKIDKKRFGISEQLENIIVGYFSTGYEKEIRPVVKQCLQAYTKAFIERLGESQIDASSREEAHKEGILAANAVVNSLKGNQEIIKQYTDRGINADLWTKDFARTYTVEDFVNADETKQRNLEAELGHIRRLLDAAGYQTSGLADEQIHKNIKQISESPEVRSASADLREEFKHHVRNLRRYERIDFSKNAGVTLYASQDLLDNFNMGTYVGSCTSLTSGCNSFNGFVVGIDINKIVIYARLEDSQIIGRNLCEITREGIVPNEFYDTLNLDTDRLWIDFLHEYSQYLRIPLIVPEVFLNAAKEARLKEKGYQLSEANLTLDKAVFSHYYRNGFGGTVEIGPSGKSSKAMAYAR